MIKRSIKVILASLLIICMIIILLLLFNETNYKNANPKTDDILYNGYYYPKIETETSKIRLLSHWKSEDAKQLIDTFKAVYNTDVELVYAEYNLIPQTLEKLQKSGQKIDVVLFTPTQYPIDFAKGQYIPLDDYINFGDDIWHDAKKASDKLRYNGKMYIVAEYGVDRFIWYNSSIFKKNGLKTPLELYNEGEWTWEKLSEDVGKIVKDDNGDGDFDTLGIMGGGGILSSLFASKNTFFTVLTPEGIRNASLDKDIADCMNYEYDLFQKQNFKYDNVVGQKYFLDGRLAMLYDGTWIISTDPGYKEIVKNGDLGFVPLPRWKNQKETIYSTEFTGFMIPKNVENLNGALAFIACNRIIEKSNSAVKQKCDEMKNFGFSQENIDIYHNLNTNDIKISIPLCSVTNNPNDNWQPFSWLLDEKHKWSFIKLRTNTLFTDQIYQFNQKYEAGSIVR